MLGLTRSANKKAVLTMCGSVFSENRILTNMEMYLKVTEHEKGNVYAWLHCGHVSQAMRVKIKPGCRVHKSFGVCSLYRYKLHFITCLGSSGHDCIFV